MNILILCLLFGPFLFSKGGTLSSSLKELYSEGGIPRLYQGLPFAIVQVLSSSVFKSMFDHAPVHLSYF